MKFSPEDIETMAAVLAARTESFVELVHKAGLDPAQDLIGTDLRRVNFRADDLTGFDFARADLTGADFSRARGLHPSMFVGAVSAGGTSWPVGFRPGLLDVSWAEDWGRDRYGVWARFGVTAADGTRVMQRLRWIPPGRFMMGSPESEEGRYLDEGPVHEVVLLAGFWLFDTPCPQALWQAVMGANPSNFVSPARPVERVSFEDVQGFLKKINAVVPGLELGLPSEAQWEYACRAGTTMATYAGEMRIVGERNAPVLDGIAWYGGNSGVDFDLDNGHDSSDWSEKQYAHIRAGTRQVCLKAPNAWGLHDMLGNVWEWCADQWHDSYDGAPTDGSAWIAAKQGAANRVVRGGCWFSVARRVRAACRAGYGPGNRAGDLGFRCARVQVSGSE